MKNVFKSFDPRLAAELRAQRRIIVKGLLCVIATSLLTSATIPIIGHAVRAIKEASGYASTSGPTVKLPGQDPTGVDARRLAQELRVSEPAAERALRAATSSDSPPSDSRRAQAVRVLGLLSLLVVGVYIVKYWFTRGQSFYLTKAGAELGAQLRVRLFQKLHRLPVTYFNEKRTGAIQSVLTNDVGVYQSAIGIVRDSIDGPIKAVSALAMVIWLHWQLAAVSMIFIPIMALVIQRNGRKMRQAQSAVQRDLSNLSAMTQEAIYGSKVVKAFAAEDRVAESYATLVDKTLKSQLAAARRLASLRPLVELIGAVALAVVLYLCGQLAFHGTLDVADIAALVFAMDVINQGFRALGYVNNTYNQVQAAAQRIYAEILDVPEEHASETGTKSITEPKGSLEFRDVWFTYPDGTAALRGVSFVIGAGTSLALVGPSGAGKSTIADLVLRFYDPARGAILFDGVDIRELDMLWYRNQIGVVPQHTFLFAGTIAENIRLGAPESTDAAVAAAAAAAHAATFIEAMPNGYQSELGEQGIRLSGGEKQRVAIARAIARKPTLLLLDEATSNLDAESERAVQSALEQVMRERTTLYIAHRLSTASRADTILVLRRGEVVESGSHAALVERDGAYAGMFRAYSSGVLLESLD